MTGLSGCIITFINALLLLVPVSKAVEKVKVDAFGEQLCPDTTRFLEQQLSPLLEKTDLLKLVDLNYYPFGKAECNKTDEKISCRCQHREDECLGNQLQNLILAKTSDKIAALAMVICLQGQAIKNPSQIESCLKWRNVKPDEVLSDAKSPASQLLHYQAGQKNPKELDYVPWININGKRSKAAEGGLINAICRKIPKISRPQSCS